MAIIYQLALLGCLGKSALQNNLRVLNISPATDRPINPAEMTNALYVLLKDGWLQRKGTEWQLTADHENAAFLWLHAHPDV